MASLVAPAAAVPSEAKAAPVRSERLHLYDGAKPAAPAAGSVTDRTLVTADGLTRTYRLFVPAGLTGKAPLLVALHGGLGSGMQFEAGSGFNRLATANGFVVAYPDGVARFADGTGGARTWNAGRCCGPAVARAIDDVAFLRAVVRDVDRLHRVDRSRVYAAGHSNGGMMAMRLACEASDVFVAVGVASSALEISRCSPRRPVSLLQIHGSADGLVPIDGGRGSGLAGVAFSPPRDAARTMARAGECRARPVELRDAANPDLRLSRWRSCTPGIRVEFLAVAGAGHAWMGQPSASPWADECMGTPYPSLDASRALWAFLSTRNR